MIAIHNRSDQFAKTRETLLLRMLGAGRVLSEALEDLALLPDGAWEKTLPPGRQGAREQRGMT